MGPVVVVICCLAVSGDCRTDGRPSIRLEGQGVSGPPAPLLLAPSPNGAQLIRAGRRRRGRWPAITWEERGSSSGGLSPTVSTSWCGPRTPRTRPCLDRRRRYLRRQPERRGRSRGANSAVCGAPPRTAGPRSRAREPRPGAIRGDPGEPAHPLRADPRPAGCRGLRGAAAPGPRRIPKEARRVAQEDGFSPRILGWALADRRALSTA